MGYRYIGSKDKLSSIIISEIKKINQNAIHIIDLMAGTGLFSLALRENNYKVTAVDVMTYSLHHLNVHLFLDKAPDFKNINKIENIYRYATTNLFGTELYQTLINYLNGLPPKQDYFYKEFSPDGEPTNATKPRKYFTPSNAAKIDTIREEIKKLKENGIINNLEHSLLIHDLIMAVNEIANIAGTYGHYLSKFNKRALDPIIMVATQFSNVGNLKGHIIYREYAENIAESLKGDLCYIDPPYIKRQYAANYHLLETIAREDKPEAMGESGLRPWRDQYSNFCSKVKIFSSFEKILTNIDVKDFLISYSEDGLININELVKFFKQFGHVSKKQIKYKRFKSNNSNKPSHLHEYLIHIARY